MARFQRYRTDGSRIRWRLLGGNNRVLCVGVQWHTDHVTAMAEVALVRLVAPEAGVKIEHEERPDVLLMDEPCSVLDPTSTRRIEETIAELRQEVTIVIVTHNMQQAARVSQHCAFFLAEDGEPGHIVESGATDTIFSRPSDPRTVDYVHGRFG